MRPLLHPGLVNGRSGDPALYIETLFERSAVLFDLGDISDLSPRKIQRLAHVFVSHTHIDHFIGFDRLLRVLVGREKKISLYGPSGFIDNVHHKLRAYRWNLVDRYIGDLVLLVTEIEPLCDPHCAISSQECICCRGSRCYRISEGDPARAGFPRFDCGSGASHLCLAFAIEETAHVNVWKNRLAESAVGRPWLRELKRAAVEDLGRTTTYPTGSGSMLSSAREMPLGVLRSVLTVAWSESRLCDRRRRHGNQSRGHHQQFITPIYSRGRFCAGRGWLATERAI
jgi:ribonuclease Z